MPPKKNEKGAELNYMLIGIAEIKDHLELTCINIMFSQLRRDEFQRDILFHAGSQFI